MTDERNETLDAGALTEAAEDESAQPHDRAFLVVYLPEGGRTRVVELPEGEEVTFGRSRASTVMVDDEKVSRTHARIVRRGAELVVEDLGSRNGTRVNGQRIEAPTRVSSGDEIRVGPALAVVGVTTLLRRRAPIGSTSYLEERLGAEIDRSGRYHRPLGLLMLRVTGAGVGPALDRAAAVLRRMDCLAEYAPDEFAVVLPEANRAASLATARRLAREMRAAGAFGGGVIVHVGLASFPDDAPTPGDLLSRARAALRLARTGGGDDGVAAAPEETTPVADRIVVAPEMKRVYELVGRIADTPITVLILGETGVGKELVAEELHRKSARVDKPFVKLNCASLPETLLESELFGHERGAFTGADRRKLGYFEAAAGGTLFLDEIGELPLGLQPKLLRVLEARKLTRLGGTAEIEVDVRLVCATNRDLEAEVRRGRFREDLFFRISTFSLFLPPLRDRRVEIKPLAEYFARQFARDLKQEIPTLGDEAIAALERYSWPGNVRELKNVIERAVVLSQDGRIQLEDLSDRVREGESRGEAFPAAAADVRQQIAEVERSALVAALEACGGNQTHAAKRLGLSRRALIYKLEKYGLKPPPGSTR